jgi:hypothetical protein
MKYVREAGSAIANAVIRRLLAQAARVQTRVKSDGICSGER